MDRHVDINIDIDFKRRFLDTDITLSRVPAEGRVQVRFYPKPTLSWAARDLDWARGDGFHGAPAVKVG